MDGDYSYSGSEWTWQEIFAKLFKYFMEGLVVMLVARYIPKQQMDWKEAAGLGAVAAIVFALLDMFSPSVGVGARFGAGAGIGLGLVGYPPVA